MQAELQHKAHEFEHEKQEEIRVGLVNIVSDSVTITTFAVILTMRDDGRQALTNTIGRISQGMSQTGKAFILILAADVLMGYHSEEGWTAGIELLSEHYMVEVGVRSCSLPPARFVGDSTLLMMISVTIVLLLYPVATGKGHKGKASAEI